MSDNYPFNDENKSQESSNSSSFVYENNSSPKKPKNHTGLKAVAFVLCMAIVGGGSIQIYKYMNDDKIQVSDFEEKSTEISRASIQQSLPDSSISENPEDVRDIPSLIEIASRTDAKYLPDIVDTIMPSVVGIASTFEYTPEMTYNPWGMWGGYSEPETREIPATGTGIVMSEDGYIITNAHVIYDDSEYKCGEAIDVSVVFSDETEHDAKIIAYDTETDIAVLKVDETGLTPAEFGSSDDLRVGELVIAVGNPLGFELFGSVTSGIVSAKNRQIDINEKSMTLIQTDAAINSGNSGGPLLNSAGQVIGINSAKISSSYGSASVEGLCFAIPINEAKIIIDDLINYKYVKGRPQIGISTVDVTESVSRYYDIPLGVYVQNVQEGGAADLAGIQKGDVIIEIDGEAVTTADELNKIKNNHKAGETISLTVTRAGEDIKIELILQEANSDKGIPFGDETSTDDN
ncbi:MAG: trypsin-like peptidase domain-containing protein [Prevotella sp.]|nr:trypsin-like peptidase domain-containing protein [Alistipes senegalensis]MCM1358407.1 trypsin-like peptidase domain-containing protein [Prevotella sp.]MCM1474129.1 trypsin-like peptidase domain-containing protein [Muribaculaceae bacterium]